jgi:hypothetical protein
MNDDFSDFIDRADAFYAAVASDCERQARRIRDCENMREFVARLAGPRHPARPRLPRLRAFARRWLPRRTPRTGPVKHAIRTRTVDARRDGSER